MSEQATRSVRKISFKPLAFESLGVRSMASLIETPDLRILVDPGVSLGIRFGLLPHPQEYKARAELRDLLGEASQRADVIAVSHYHYDHYTPNFTENVLIGSSPEEAVRLIQDKILFVKDFRTQINPSQRRRGWFFQRFAEKHSKEMHAADGKEFSFGGTKLRFSKPVYHGESGSGLGWVLMLIVSYGEEKVMHASDIQGPIDETALTEILPEKPELLVVGGPPLYLSGSTVKEDLITRGRENLIRTCEKIPVSIVDHHLLRSADWKTFIEPAIEAANSKGNVVLSAAEYEGSPNRLLECRREELYEQDPPSLEFRTWTRLPKEKRRTEPPPV